MEKRARMYFKNLFYFKAGFYLEFILAEFIISTTLHFSRHLRPFQVTLLLVFTNLSSHDPG